MNYWAECISVAADECGLTITKEQINYLADAVEGANDNYSTAHGYDCIRIESDAEKELKTLKASIAKREQFVNKTVPCRDCITTGLVKDGWGRDTTCMLCNGRGRY